MRRHAPFAAAMALGLAAAAAFPLVAGDYGIGVGLSLLSWIALAASWGVLSGMTGYISLGQRKNGFSSFLGATTPTFTTADRRLKITISKVFGDLYVA